MTNTHNSLNIDKKLTINPNAKIVLDSNIFLNYLWISTKEFKTFIKIIKAHTKEIIFTEQTLDELYRNMPLNFEKNKESKLSKSGQSFDISSLRFVDKEDRKILEKTKDIIKKNNEEHIKSYNENYNILEDFLKTNINKYTIIPRTNFIVDKAIKRKYIGNPPCSNKTTVGDEIIWESLLSWNKNDIIIVTGDNGFIKNKEFLIKEYKEKTECKLIDIYDELDLTDAIETIDGEKENPELTKLKEIEENEKKSLSDKFYEIIAKEYMQTNAYKQMLKKYNLIDTSYDTSYIRNFINWQNINNSNLNLDPINKLTEINFNTIKPIDIKLENLDIEDYQRILSKYKLNDISQNEKTGEKNGKDEDAE